MTALAALFSCFAPPVRLPPASAAAAHPSGPARRAAYSTRFSRAENPISDGGHWINGAAVGLDWGDVSVTPGHAIGHSGTARYADATALLTGAWSPDQSAQATVFAGRTFRNPEVELRLRSALSPHRATGYEISFAVSDDPSAYLIIVRWNGPLADFTYLARLYGSQYGVKTGDVVKAMIVGNVITAYKNGRMLAQVSDNAFSSGNPGMGFNEGGNGDYGWTSFSASDETGAGKAPTEAAERPIAAPLRQSKNPNYFQDASGSPILLCGSQSWNTLQDWGTDGAPRPLDFAAFVRFLRAHGHNFTLLWRSELPKLHGLPTTETSPPDLTVGPHPWKRTGPGLATDGGLKFDLTQFDPAYFRRLRSRTKALRRARVYAGVYLFTGEFLLRFRSSTDGYPFSGPNNVNGVDDGYRGGANATTSVTMTAPNAIIRYQDAYVKKTIDVLCDLPNVVWIVSEEAPAKSVWWNDHMISLVRAYEKRKRYRHPIGFATLESPPDSLLYDSDADWVAPSARVSPARSCGIGDPPCKVNVNDSDHSYFGMWNDSPQKNRNFAWENFASGNQVLFMDPYLVDYPRQNRNRVASPVNGIGSEPDLRWENFRNTLGDLLRFSRKLDLARVTPRSALSSTGYCLAQTPAAGAEYLVYAPSGGSFTVDLSAMPSSRTLSVTWFNPATGSTVALSPIAAGSSRERFAPPFEGDSVLYLEDTAGHR
jgi:hypothetical protein